MNLFSCSTASDREHEASSVEEVLDLQPSLEQNTDQLPAASGVFLHGKYIPDSIIYTRVDGRWRCVLDPTMESWIEERDSIPQKTVFPIRNRVVSEERLLFPDMYKDINIYKNIYTISIVVDTERSSVVVAIATGGSSDCNWRLKIIELGIHRKSASKSTQYYFPRELTIIQN